MEPNKKRSCWKYIAYALVGLISIGLFLLSGMLFIINRGMQAPQTENPPFTTPVQSSSVTDSQIAAIDQALRDTLTASIAYQAPQSMKLDETTAVELLIHPAVEPAELGDQFNGPGQVVTASVEVTPRTRAELIPQDEQAFLIRPLHDGSEQFLSTQEPTRWEWDVTARKGGLQRLTLVIYRLITVDGKENWRQVETYRSDIQVNVTVGQQIRKLDWKWISGILMILAALFVFWRSQVKKGTEQRSSSGPSARQTQARRPEPENLGRIFISYRRSDSADIAGRIYDSLVEKFGRELIFKDVDSIPLGVDFKQYLDQKVGSCRVLLAILGDHWLDAADESGKRRLEDPADFVRIEIESALTCGIPVIPLLVRGAAMPLEKDLPPGLGKLVYKNGVQIRPDPDFHRDMDRLISALNKYVGS